VEINNYIVQKSGVNTSTYSQAGEIIWIHKSIKNTISNYTQWSERIIELKLNMGERKLLFLDSMPLNKEEFKKAKPSITNYRKYHTKLTKNDYILLSGELNKRTGNSEIHNIAGSFRKPAANTNALKLRDFCHI
jgi:hypothetical protein